MYYGSRRTDSTHSEELIGVGYGLSSRWDAPMRKFFGAIATSMALIFQTQEAAKSRPMIHKILSSPIN